VCSVEFQNRGFEGVCDACHSGVRHAGMRFQRAKGPSHVVSDDKVIASSVARVVDLGVSYNDECGSLDLGKIKTHYCP
jgi:hypothetical protein